MAETTDQNSSNESPPTPESLEEAEQLKAEANELFKREKYVAAVEVYSQAISINPNNAVYYANRSIAHHRQENFGYALIDASKAIEVDKMYLKAYYRRAAAYMSLGKYKMALKDYERVYKVRPNDSDAKAKFTECKKIVNQIAFQKAISVEETKTSICDSLNLEGMEVEDKYDGPKLTEDKKVSVGFVQHLMQHYKAQKKLHRRYAFQILLDVKAYFESQPSLIDITVPEDKKFTICGDIHGQYYDLMNIFELNGVPSEDNPYLFNGDFVDRGSFSVECIFVLFSFKLLYPNHFFMSRGNHESENMNKMYGFEGEVKAKYSANMVDLFTEVYNWLPLAHNINNRILVMHGGLFSKDGITLDEIRKTERNRQPPEDGIMCELLWSDPQPMRGRSPSKRGVGCQFGPDVTQNFLDTNGMDYVVRSHEVKDEGYEVCHDGKCITVFSAPNYCDSMGNKGAFITLKGSSTQKMEPKFTTFELFVEAPPGRAAGSVHQNVSFGRRTFDINDANGVAHYIVKGPTACSLCCKCFCVCCRDRGCFKNEVDFGIFLANGDDTQVGVITKLWAGPVERELGLSEFTRFSVDFPLDITLKMKCVILAACFVIDYLYFESDGGVEEA